MYFGWMNEKITTFEDLNCWKYGRDLRREMIKLIKTFPLNEKFKLSDQIIRCSRSITNNIAEGFGRYHYLENAKFCRNSRGSLWELLDHLLIAEECEYINQEQMNDYRQKIIRCNALINGYINYLQKSSKENKPNNV